MPARFRQWLPSTAHYCTASEARASSGLIRALWEVKSVGLSGPCADVLPCYTLPCSNNKCDMDMLRLGQRCMFSAALQFPLCEVVSKMRAHTGALAHDFAPGQGTRACFTRCASRQGAPGEPARRQLDGSLMQHCV